MKATYKILAMAAIVAGGMGFGACTGDLDLTPTSPTETTAGDFSSDPDMYMESVFADLMLNFCTYGASGSNVLNGVADGGFSTFQRALFNTEVIPTDEACWLYYTNDAEVGTLPFGMVSASTGMATAPYYRFIVNCSLANDFLESCNRGDFDGANTDNMNYMKTMARTLREICMYYMLDLYGGGPWVDDDTQVGSTPKQVDAATMYANLVAEMEANLGDYDKYAPTSIPYGYFGKDCHQAYLMKLYLNAETYCGTPDWANAYKHAKAIIDRHSGGFNGSGLCQNYNQLFGKYNYKYAPGGGDVNEILWTLPGSETTSNDDGSVKRGIETYGGAVLMLAGWLNNAGDVTDFTTTHNWDGQWNCIVTRSQLAEQFDWTDSNMSQSTDSRVRFWLTSAHGFSFSGAELDYTQCPNNGYPAIKFSNWVIDDNGNIDYSASGNSATGGTLSVDYPMVRLAEVYLSAAEAILNGGGGSVSDAVTYVNYIRQRAGLSEWSSLTTADLRNERQRELYTECTRRTDLRRYGLWISGYNWDFKGSTSNIEGQDFLPTFDIYPFPSTVVSMAGYTQNPGY